MNCAPATGLDDVLSALAAGEACIVLPAHHGPSAVAAMIRLALEDHPDARPKIFLDCADEAGMVMNALRNGLTRLLFDGPPETLHALQDMAREYGAEVHAPHSIGQTSS